MNPTELKAVCSLAAIYMFRMLGLFMILPVLSLYVDNLRGATPALMGMALGIYGLTQGLLQLPYGIASDHLGRKKVIIFGLIIFVMGCIVAAASTSIYGIIVGRALQGAGAIGSVLLAFVGDVTRLEVRTKAMAIIGITIGSSFTLAMILGPLLDAWIHLSGIFLVTGTLGFTGICLVLFALPQVPLETSEFEKAKSRWQQFLTVLKHKELLYLDFGIFALHTILTAAFVAIPFVLEQGLGITQSRQMWLYLPVLIIAFIAMMPLIMLAERKNKLIPVFILAISGIIISQLLLITAEHSVAWSAIWLCLFFTVFSTLEACLPSLVSRHAPGMGRGAAMGVYSTAQFMGIFVGGAVGGWVFGHYHATGVFLFCAAVASVWLVVAGVQVFKNK